MTSVLRLWRKELEDGEICTKVKCVAPLFGMFYHLKEEKGM